MEEDARLVAVRAGEGAAAMAEELVFEQILRNGSAVDGEEARDEIAKPLLLLRCLIVDKKGGRSIPFRAAFTDE